MVDAPNSTMIGFPLAYSCNGWHTSGAQQFFLLEFVFDLLIYFGFWSILFFAFDKFIRKISILKITHIILTLVSCILTIISLIID